MRQIVYFSTASGRQDGVVTAEILAVSRERNRHENVTGLLIADGNRYLQVVEGSAAVVEATIARIRRDQRHLGMAVLIDRTISERSFAGWSMAFREEPTFDHFATLEQLIDRMREQVRDARLREQLDCFARSFTVAPVHHVPSPWTQAAQYDPSLTLDRSH